MDNAQIENKSTANIQRISRMARFFQDPYAGHTTAVNIPQCTEI